MILSLVLFINMTTLKPEFIVAQETPYDTVLECKAHIEQTSDLKADTVYNLDVIQPDIHFLKADGTKLYMLQTCASAPVRFGATDKQATPKD